MAQIIEVMRSSFEAAKEQGSYFLFYILCLGLGLAISWERYTKSETGNNWMLEEAKQKIPLWPFLYGLLSLLFIVANPVVIFFWNKLTPMEGQYTKTWPLLMLIFFSAYGIVCFLSLVREERQKVILLVGFILIIGLAGNFYGLLSNEDSVEKKQQEQLVAEYLQQKEEPVHLLAADAVLEYVGNVLPEVFPIYGKDLYSPNLDLGILDTYDPELMRLYEAMKNPKENLEYIAENAYLYDCNVLVVSEFENPPKKVGSYLLDQKVGSYFIYVR